jgi:hypothetical protein
MRLETPAECRRMAAAQLGCSVTVLNLLYWMRTQCLKYMSKVLPDRILVVDDDCPTQGVATWTETSMRPRGWIGRWF